MLEKLVYRYLFQPPDAQRVPGAQYLESACGHRTLIKYIAMPGATRVLLFSHGNGEDVAQLWRLPQLVECARVWNCSLMLYEYCGYGELTESEPCESCCLHNIECVYEWLRTLWRPEQIILWGFSLGSGPSCWLAAQHQEVSALLLQSPFLSVRTMAQEMVGRWAHLLTHLINYGFPNDKHIQKVRCPVFLIHGLNDSSIPCDQGKELAALGSKVHTWFPDCDHNDMLEHPNFVGTVAQWLNQQ
jgi:pimeloyl-ACP methyl ester carboxylesterase